MKVTVIVPFVRMENFDRCIESIRKNHGLSEDPEIIWEQDELGIGCPRMVKKLVDKSTTDLVCFLGDDTEPQPNFLRNALAMMRKLDLWMVGFNDTHTVRPTHWLASKKLLNERGEFFDTRFVHNYSDTELMFRAERLGKYAWCEQAVVLHHNPLAEKNIKQIDKFYQRGADYLNQDENLFHELCSKVSVGMIVKNEEVMLAECLESVKGADEIVVVDTGSTDRTKEIAARYTDKIYDFKWIDDFAAARNFVISKCSHDWILSIDADQLLLPGSLEHFKAFLRSNVEMLTIGTHMVDPGVEYYVPRFFRNVPCNRWQGMIHEAIVLTPGRHIELSEVKITSRFSPAHTQDPDRSVRILLKAVEKEPTSSRYWYYLGREYCYLKEFEKAVSCLDKCVSFCAWLPERADAYYLKALSLWYLCKGDKAREACFQALSINSEFKSASLLMAEMSWDHNKAGWLRMANGATNQDVLFRRETLCF